MGILTVFLDKATNLKDTDIIGKSDPYIILSLEQDNYFKDKDYGYARSTTKRDELNPVYHETFHFNVPTLKNMVLTVKVVDEDIMSDDKMGNCKIKLGALELDSSPMKVTKKVYNRMFGKDSYVHLKLSYSEEGDHHQHGRPSTSGNPVAMAGLSQQLGQIQQQMANLSPARVPVPMVPTVETFASLSSPPPAPYVPHQPAYQRPPQQPSPYQAHQGVGNCSGASHGPYNPHGGHQPPQQSASPGYPVYPPSTKPHISGYPPQGYGQW
ncbi:hypothetical protein ACHAWF_017844 [Thalassiosira exigua]